MSDTDDEISFRAIDEPQPGRQLREVFEEYWPAYRKWMARAERIDPAHCIDRLGHHMPELVPVFEHLIDLFEGNDEVVRFLSLYRPPRIVRACTQAVVIDDGCPVLVRNYDHAPHLCDGIILASAWQGTRVMAITDCIWGALDGINEHGLAVALAFGGRPVTGDGFAASLIVRYLLQTCRSVAQARELLTRASVYMPYTFVVCDPSGDYVTAYLSPDRPARLQRADASANHQGRVEWTRYARVCQTELRLARAQQLLQQPGVSVDSVLVAFLKEPIHRKAYARGSGTLYTSVLSTRTKSMKLAWPDASACFSINSFVEQEITVQLPQ